MTSQVQQGIMQDWTLKCGLRHQGVLVSAVRGCDTLPKHHPAKTLARYYRAVVLNAHCGIHVKPSSYMELVEDEVAFLSCINQFFSEHDALPFHYCLHIMHAAEIVGYYRYFPEMGIERPHWLYSDHHGKMWLDFYKRLVRRMHLVVESKQELDARLDADEKSFGAAQHQ